jgi:hypothetical protein
MIAVHPCSYETADFAPAADGRENEAKEARRNIRMPHFVLECWSTRGAEGQASRMDVHDERSRQGKNL